MPRVLAISRFFPPLGSAGASIRLIKTIKYASALGWSFTVLTQDPDRPVIPEKKLCGFLLEEIPSDTEIIRVGKPGFNNSIIQKMRASIGSKSSIPWGAASVWRCWRSLRKTKPDLIFVNSPPFTNVGIGYLLSLLFKVPLIIDLKDDWIGSLVFFQKGRVRQEIERWVESIVFQKASAIVTVTASSFDSCLKRYPSKRMMKKIFNIPNGEDLDEYRKIREIKREREGSNIRILSAAAGYRSDYRDLSPFLLALEQFLKRSPEVKSQIEIEFLGENPDEVYKNKLSELLPPSQVIYKDSVNRAAFVDELWKADIFFLIQPRGNSTAISGTLYEYWATGKAPVILFSEKGASSDLVEKHNLGRHFYFDQTKEASLYLEELVDSNFAGHPSWIEYHGIESWDRQKLTAKMVKIWQDVLTASGRE